MKIQMRRNVFETNSSSTHSLCVSSKLDYDKWKNGELVYNRYEDVLIPITEEIRKYMEDGGSDFETYDKFFCEDRFESYEKEYTSKSGDEFIIFEKWGYDR